MVEVDDIAVVVDNTPYLQVDMAFGHKALFAWEVVEERNSSVDVIVDYSYTSMVHDFHRQEQN